MVPILSAGVGASSAPTSPPAADELEAHSRHDTYHHHPHHHHRPQHHRRSRRNSTFTQGDTSTTPRKNDAADRRAELVEPNLNPSPHAHQRGSAPEGDGMHVMSGESLEHMLLAASRVALGLPAVAAGVGSEASGYSSDSEEDGVMIVRRRKVI